MSEMSTGLKTHFTLSLLWSNKNSDNHNLHIKCRFYLQRIVLHLHIMKNPMEAWK